MDNSEQAKAYFEKYSKGIANSEEQAFVESWLLRYPLENRADLDKREKDADLAEVRANLVKLSNPRSLHRRLWLRIAIAAAAIVVVFGVWLTIHSNDQERAIQEELLTKAIKPGKNTATLTLASGKTINLSDAKTGVVIDASKITYSDGTVLDPSSRQHIPVGSVARASEMTIVSTPVGGTYQVVLPDKTRVWLNAASSLKFPSNFTGSTARKVELLSGEAYFEVAKVAMDRKGSPLPFIVLGGGQEVEVLGTHFNINSYADEKSVKTTLLEGSVRVRPLAAKMSPAVLRPDQQSVLAGQTLKIIKADTEEAIAWKEGLFRFEGTDLKSLMRQISRWYNIKVAYEGEVSNDSFSGVIKRSANISEIISILKSGGLDVKIVSSPEKKIIISQ